MVRRSEPDFGMLHAAFDLLIEQVGLLAKQASTLDVAVRALARAVDVDPDAATMRDVDMHSTQAERAFEQPFIHEGVDVRAGFKADVH